MMERPSRTDPKWNDYVMSLLEQDETYNGNPKTDGLRRIAQIVIGPIIDSISSPTQQPNPNNNSTSTVTHKVTFFNKFTDDPDEPKLVTYQDVADSSPDNTAPEYARYPSATCATKAEGRALRKALGLTRVIAAEEAASFSGEEIKAVDSQILYLDKECKVNDLNVREFIKAMKAVDKTQTKYNKLKDVPYKTMAEWLRRLNDMSKGRQPIADNIKGYQENWQ